MTKKELLDAAKSVHASQKKYKKNNDQKKEDLAQIAADISMNTLAEKDLEEFNKNWILIEDRDIYDGWCAKVNKLTGEIVWREEYFTKRIGAKERERWERQLRFANPELFSDQIKVKI